MSRDTELDRLAGEKDRAFERQSQAWRAQDQAWKRRSATRDAMNRAYEEKARANAIQESAWQDLQSVRGYNGPRIDNLNTAQEAAFQNMKSAFERASYAHDSRDGASARSYADEGHRYKSESQDAVAERRQLVEEIRAAHARHDATRPAFQQAKAQYARVRSEFDDAKASHERAQREFQHAKAEAARTKAAFERRLATVRAESGRRRDDKRSLAERAGVPRRYLDDVWVSTSADGTTNIYFGGLGSPNGLGHGHYALDASGQVTYQRDPFDPHGAENFSDYEERRQQSSWDPAGSKPPDVGVIAGTDHVVSFKTGGPTGDQTLIADDDFSDDPTGFDDKHNHYGSKREGGQIDKDRGHYTGPDH